MAVSPIAMIQSSAKISDLQRGVEIAPKPQVSFSEILNGTKNRDLHVEISQLQQQLLNNRELSPRELLLYQIKVGRMGMQVELVSKLSESLIATSRRLQSSQ